LERLIFHYFRRLRRTSIILFLHLKRLIIIFSFNFSLVTGLLPSTDPTFQVYGALVESYLVLHRDSLTRPQNAALSAFIKLYYKIQSIVPLNTKETEAASKSPCLRVRRPQFLRCVVNTVNSVSRYFLSLFVTNASTPRTFHSNVGEPHTFNRESASTTTNFYPSANFAVHAAVRRALHTHPTSTNTYTTSSSSTPSPHFHPHPHPTNAPQECSSSCFQSSEPRSSSAQS
jgi:hypothetical protein